jgi:hypothetical protein
VLWLGGLEFGGFKEFTENTPYLRVIVIWFGLLMDMPGL